MKLFQSHRSLSRGRSRKPAPPSRNSAAVALGLATAALGITALVNHRLAKRAERNTPVRGKILDIDGTRLHYVERGSGKTLVLLHGNGSMIQDFESSGLLDEAARSYRVIAFDRPGFGHSTRPRRTIWTPDAQADLLHKALVSLGAGPAIVLGHSWGASVAVALAAKYSQSVKALVLASGYYYPSARLDVVLASGPAVPITGDILRYTLAPILGRLLWPALMRKVFGPAEVPDKFEAGFPVAMALRPSQIRASAAESALMIPDAVALRDRYGALRMPVVIIAGDCDRVVDIDQQSARLHDDIAQSSFHSIPGGGHMIHQTALPAVMKAIHEAAGEIPAAREAAPA